MPLSSYRPVETQIFSPRPTRNQGGASMGSAAETAPPLLKGTDRPQEIDLAKGRPQRIGEIEFAVRALPQQETREADHTAGADDQVGVRQTGRIEMAGDGLRSDAIDR